MSNAICEGSLVIVPTGDGRRHEAIMEVSRIEGNRAWCRRMGTDKIEGPFPVSILRPNEPSGPLRPTF